MKLSKKAEVIKTRHNKVVYRDVKRIVKVFNSNKPASDVFNEALNLSRIQETGIRVPKILEVSQVEDGAWALSTEYIPGVTLRSLIDAADGEEKTRLLETFVDLQIEIMSYPAPKLLNKQRNKLAGMIARVKEIDPSSRYDLQMRTDRMRGAHTICHGDFNPSNVIVGDDGQLYVCDWTHVTDDSAYLWFRIEEPREGIDDGFYITNGKMIHVTWDKADDYEPTLFYDDNGKEVTVNQGRTMIFIIRDDTDDFEINGLTYYPDDHKTLTEADFEDDSSEESTSEEAEYAEEPEEEEW